MAIPFRSTFVLLSALTAAGCSKHEVPPAKPAQEATEITLTPVIRTDWPRTVDVVGTVFGDDEATIASKVGGRVLSVKADLGDRVAGGAVLAEIDPVDYRLEVVRRRAALTEALSKLGLTELPGDNFDVTKVSTVERAHYQAENAKARFERAKKLFEQKPPLISEQDYADLQTAYDVALRDADVAKLDAQSSLAAAESRKSELDLAQQAVNDAVIKAPPVQGDRTYAVAQRSIAVGEYVSVGTAAYRLVLDNVVKFRASLPERVVSDLQVGQKVTLQMIGHNQPAIGIVARISPSIDVATRTFQIEATFDNTDGRLRPGAFLRGIVDVGLDKNLAMVPKEAVVTFAGISKVFSVMDGKAVEYAVNVRGSQGNNVVLTEPIAGVEAIVTTGGGRLAGGAPVKVTGNASGPASTQPSP
jgi:RND family efflux transporter MFP subunit